MGGRGERRSGGSSAAFGSLDELFFPTKHESQQELIRQTVLPAPAPTPGDGPGDIYEGRIRITL